MKNSYKIEGEIAYIYFRTKEGCFLIDSDDFEKISQSTWHKDSTGYPATIRNGEHKRCHQVVMGNAPKGLVTDHINRNRLDNRKSNLRIVTPRENCLNRTKVQRVRNSIYHRKGKRHDSYKVEIHDKEKRTTYIGSYRTYEEAVSVRDAAFELLDKGDLTPLEIKKLRKSKAGT